MDAFDATVVVLSWNTKALTLAALRAVPAAVAPHRALTICVDNASADGTAAAVRDALPTVLVVENRANLGFARGNDAALPFARGRVVVFLNSDTEASPGSLARVIDHLDRDPRAGIAAPPLVGVDGRPQRTVWGVPTTAALLHQYTPLGWVGIGRRATRAQRDEGRDAKSGPVEAVSGAALAIRRDLCDRLGGFDPHYPFYVEDVDLCWRARRLGFEVHFVADAPPVLHVGGASASLSEGATRLPLLAGFLRLQRKRLPPPAYAAFATAFKLGVIARAMWEVVRAPVVAPLRRLRGRRERAARTWAMARERRRFLERDLAAFLRA